MSLSKRCLIPQGTPSSLWVWPEKALRQLGDKDVALQNGLYAIRFRTQTGPGGGVVYAQDGLLRGGNSMMAYLGDYTESNGTIQACVRSYVHTPIPGMEPAFGVDDAVIRLTGVVDGPNVIFTGTSQQAPGVTLTATMERLHD